jgi:hypothetical protein
MKESQSNKSFEVISSSEANIIHYDVTIIPDVIINIHRSFLTQQTFHSTKNFFFSNTKHTKIVTMKNICDN